MTVEEVFQSKAKKSQIAKEWKEAERGKDPLIEFWKKRKRQGTVCDLEKHRSTS